MWVFDSETWGAAHKSMTAARASTTEEQWRSVSERLSKTFRKWRVWKYPVRIRERTTSWLFWCSDWTSSALRLLIGQEQPYECSNWSGMSWLVKSGVLSVLIGWAAFQVFCLVTWNFKWTDWLNGSLSVWLVKWHSACYELSSGCPSVLIGRIAFSAFWLVEQQWP